MYRVLLAHEAKQRSLENLEDCYARNYQRLLTPDKNSLVAKTFKEDTAGLGFVSLSSDSELCIHLDSTLSVERRLFVLRDPWIPSLLRSARLTGGGGQVIALSP